MKKAALSLCIFFVISAQAQSDTLAKKIGVPFKDGAPFYEVVDTVSATKEQLFTAAKSALGSLFKNAASVTRNQDKEAGIIEGRGNYTYSYTYKRLFKLTDNKRAHFDFTIGVKENKYRIQLSNFKLSDTEAPTLNPAPYFAAYKPTGDNSLDKMHFTSIEAFHENTLIMLEAIKRAIRQQLAASEW